MNREHCGFLPATAWLGRLPLAGKIPLAAVLASSPLVPLAFSAISGQPVTVEAALICGGLAVSSWYLLAGLAVSLACSFRELRESHARLGNGDFGARMAPASTAEGRVLSSQFNDMAREVGRIVSEIRDAAAEVAHASVELKSSANLVADAALVQEQSATETAAAVEEMSVSIDEVASQSREAEMTSHAVSDLTAEGSRAIGHSSGEIQALAHAVGDVSLLMDQLAQRSSEVNLATGLIREISDQTNLLALNAAIEAARAGESGRGFAVVADEVRKLAQRARTSADEITRTVATIQSEIQQAVVHMAAAKDKATESVDHAGGVSGVLDKINAQAMTALGNVHQIASGTQQQSTTSADIARHVEQIAESAHKNSQTANESAGMASHLSYLADGMRSTLAGFKG